MYISVCKVYWTPGGNEYDEQTRIEVPEDMGPEVGADYARVVIRPYALTEWEAFVVGVPCHGCGRTDVRCARTADPFMAEIRGDDTEHWLCPSCLYESAMAI